MKSQDWRGGRVREVVGKLNSPPVLVQQRDFFSGTLLRVWSKALMDL